MGGDSKEVLREAGDFTDVADGLDGTIDRLASAVVASIDWHSEGQKIVANFASLCRGLLQDRC